MSSVSVSISTIQLFSTAENPAVVKNMPAIAGDVRDVGSIPGSGRPPGGGNDNPLQYSCLENPMDRGIWQATVHGVAKSRTHLSNRAHTHTHEDPKGFLTEREFFLATDSPPCVPN